MAQERRTSAHRQLRSHLFPNRSVPTKYPDRSAIIGIDRPSSAYLDGAATPARGAGRAHLDVQDLGPVATGKPRLTATTDSCATQ